MTAPRPQTALWHHQQAALDFILGRWDLGLRGVLLAICMGGGKSKVAIELALRKRFSPILIVCPLRVVEVWREQFMRHAPGAYEVLALDDRAGSVADKTAAARDRLAWATASHRRLAIAINYESARRDQFAHWALANFWPLVIADECVPPGSPIRTPHGDVSVEQLRTGDIILGYDHTAGRIVETPVTATFRRHSIAPLLSVCGAQMTPEHPVWTQNRGYVPASLVRASDEVLVLAKEKQEDLSAHLRILPEIISGTEKNNPARLVCNFETRTGNYFVNGLLVHNCHRVKSPSGSVSRFMGKLGRRAVHRLGLTGTPMPHSLLDTWGQCRFLDSSLFDPTYTAFRLKYAVTQSLYNGMGQSFTKVVGFQNVDEFRRRFFSIAFQVGDEVLDLPKETDQRLTTDFGPQGRRIYREMESELVATLASGQEIAAANQLTKLLRLQQITSGVLTDENHIVHRIDNSKGDLLEDLLEDLPVREPVVIFTRFRPDLELIHQIARKLGRKSGEISGERSLVTGRRDDLAEWQRGGETDPVILAVQIQAGGVGIDLTRARYGVYFSTGFSLGDYLQSRARLQRSGQKRPVVFYHLSVRQTVDAMVARALTMRQDLVEFVLRELKEKKTNDE